MFQKTERPNSALFFSRNDSNDVRLGEIVSKTRYDEAEIVIIGCPQDEGVRRNGGRAGAAFAPDRIRAQFYKLTPFGINTKIFDLGNTIIQNSLEETHDVQTEIIKQILKDGKQIISLGGGNDISYPDCRALSEIMGADNILAINIDAHFDVRDDKIRNSGTPYRQLLNEKLIKPRSFFEIGYQPPVNSPRYYEYLKNLGVEIKNLAEFRGADIGKYLHDIFDEPQRKKANSVFWGFDVDVVRAADAPGVSASSPIGLTAEEFIDLAAFAGSEKRTKIIEFAEVNPNFDIDNRTSKLTAIAVHSFCARR